MTIKAMSIANTCAFLLLVLFMSACRKDHSSPTGSGISDEQIRSAVEKMPNDKIIPYIKSFPENEQEHLIKQVTATLSAKGSGLNNQTAASTESIQEDEYTPEQIIACSWNFQTQKLGPDLPPFIQFDKQIEWEVGRNGLNLWSIQSYETLNLVQVPTVLGLEWACKGFTHNNSILKSNTKVVPGSWTETLHLHYPTNFTPPAIVKVVLSRVVGNYAYGGMLPVQLDNLCSVSIM